VYRCRAPYLAVCGAAQALSLGWVQVPVVAVHLEGDSSYIDVPRITSAASNKLGISYASFEAGRGHGQEGFSGYESYGSQIILPALNGGPGEYRPDRFSMGAFEIHSPELLKRTAAEAFAESYYQCNYPYKEFSRAALRGMKSESEVVNTLLKTCADSVPRYWRDRFHRDYDDRNVGRDVIAFYILTMSIVYTAASIGTAVAYWYQFSQLAGAAAAAAAGGASLEATSDIVAGWVAVEAADPTRLIQPAYLIYVGIVDPEIARVMSGVYVSPALTGTVNEYGWMYWYSGDYMYLVPPWIAEELRPFNILGVWRLEAYQAAGGGYAVLVDPNNSVFLLNIIGNGLRAPAVYAHMQMTVWDVLRPVSLFPRMPPLMFPW
jgi:hypothetical protein